MKKSIFKKLGGLFLGLAMGLGVAVGVAAGSKEAVPIEASSTGTYVLVTSTTGIAAGDTVIIVNHAGSQALKSISTTNTKYGTLGSVSVSNSKITLSSASVAELVVRAGNTSGSFAFEGTSTNDDGGGTAIANGKYLTWTSGNSLNIGTSISDNSSFTLNSYSASSGMTIANCSTTTRLLRYNTASDQERFACYTSSTGTLVDIYKKEVAQKYTVSFDANNAAYTGPTPSALTQSTAGAAITLPNALSCTGYTWLGWNTSSSGGQSTRKTAGSSYTPSSSHTLYGEWQINSYTVSGSITNGSLSSTANIDHGTAFTRTINPQTGYDYPETLTSLSINGVTQTAGSGYTYNSSNGQISIDASKVVGNIVINATCPKKQYSITDSVENGSLNVSSIEHGSNLTITITPDSDYKLPDSVTIKRSGSDFTSFTYENGVITIAGENVTDDFEIIGTCYQEFLINVTCNNGIYDITANIIKSGETVVIEFTANEGYIIPLTENEIDVVNAETIEYASGILEIGNATGDVTVTCTCNQITNKSVSVSMPNVENITGTGTEAIELGGEATVELDAVSGYRLPTTNAFSITGADSNIVFTNNNTHAIISLSNCSGDVVISGTPVRIFNITTNITNGTCSPSSATVDTGSEWNTTISANNGYKLPVSISVTIGGNAATLGSDYTYNASTGAVSVKSVTGAVVISASMDELATASISVVGSGSYSDKFTSSGDTTLVEGSTAEITISPKSDSSGVYFIKDTDISVEGASKISYVSNVLKIGNLEGNTVNITVTPEKREVNSIQITSNPSKTSYILGETLNTSGLKVLGTYNDGSGTVDVTTDCEVTVDGEAMFTTGSHSATVSYGNCESKTFTFNVKAKDYTEPGAITHTYTYEKVTSAPTDWRGRYLIVYNDETIFNGSLETLDAPSNTKSLAATSGTDSRKYYATDSTGKITIDDSNVDISFTVAYKTGSTSVYSLKSASGKYISGTTTNAKAANGMKTDTSDSDYEISFNGTTVESKSSDQNMVLKYNKSADQTRFRFYKSGQEAISLYKFTDTQKQGDPVPSDEKHVIRIKDADCTKTELIAGETLSVNDFNISVQYDTANTIYSNLKPTSISSTTIEEGENTYTLSFKDSYNNTVTKDIVLTGKEAPKLDYIYVTYDETWSNEFTRLDEFNSDGVHVWASYSNDYEDKEVTSSASIVPTSMSVAGKEIEVNVSYTEGGVKKETSYNIGINPIHTTSLTFVIKNSSDEIVGLTDGYYNIVPGENYSVTYTVNGDYNSVTVNSGATANTTLVNGVLSSSATANEITTFVVSCDQATNVQIPVKVVAACDATLRGFETSSTGATASITDGKHGTFSGYIGDTVAIELTTMNYTNPQVNEKEQVEGLSISGSVTNDVYSGTITISKAMTSQSYTLLVSEAAGGEEKEIVLTFTAVVDEIVGIEATPEKTDDYTVGDEFNPNMTVVATYQSGKTNNNYTDYTISGNPTGRMKRGTYTITVTANGTEVSDSFIINVVKPSGLVIITATSEMVPDPENPVTNPESGTVTPTWDSKSLGNNSRVAKNSTLSAKNIGHYLTSVTVSFEGKALSSNKGSLFNFMLEAYSRDTVVDKYTVYYTTTNEDGTGYYVTTDEYDEISLTISGISESDHIDGFVFTACDKLNGATGSANGNLDHQYESATYTYNVSVPGEKEELKYHENAVSDELYDFILKANEIYADVCGTDENNKKPVLSDWLSICDTAEYKALDQDDKDLLKAGLCGEGAYGSDGVYVASGEKQSSDMVIEFLQKYDRVISNYPDESEYNYLGRNVSSSNSKINPIIALNNVDSSVWVISAVAVAGLTAIGGYFFYRKRKEI